MLLNELEEDALISAKSVATIIDILFFLFALLGLFVQK